MCASGWVWVSLSIRLYQPLSASPWALVLACRKRIKCFREQNLKHLPWMIHERAAHTEWVNLLNIYRQLSSVHSSVLGTSPQPDAYLKFKHNTALASATVRGQKLFAQLIENWKLKTVNWQRLCAKLARKQFWINEMRKGKKNPYNAPRQPENRLTKRKPKSVQRQQPELTLTSWLFSWTENGHELIWI